jgi:hypothetical protein
VAYCLTPDLESAILVPYVGYLDLYALEVSPPLMLESPVPRYEDYTILIPESGLLAI